MGFLDSFKKFAVDQKDKYVQQLNDIKESRPELVPEKPKETMPAGKALEVGSKFFTPLIETAKKAEPLVWSVKRGIEATRAVNDREKATKKQQTTDLLKSGQDFIDKTPVDIATSEIKDKGIIKFSKDLDKSIYLGFKSSRSQASKSLAGGVKYMGEKGIDDVKNMAYRMAFPGLSDEGLSKLGILSVAPGQSEPSGISDYEMNIRKGMVELADKVILAENENIEKFYKETPYKYMTSLTAGTISMVEALGLAYISGGSTLPSAAFAAQEFGSSYSDYRDEGFDPRDATLPAGIKAITTFVTEKIGMDFLLGNMGSKIVSNRAANFLLKGGISSFTETAEEVIQLGAGNIIDNSFLKTWDLEGNNFFTKGADAVAKTFEGWVETALVTAPIGFFPGAMGGDIFFQMNTKEEASVIATIRSIEKQMGVDKTKATEMFIQLRDFAFNTFDQVKKDTRGSIPADFGLGKDITPEEMINLPEESKEAIKAILESDLTTDVKNREVEAIVQLARVTGVEVEEGSGIIKADEAHKLQSKLAEIDTKEAVLERFDTKDLRMFRSLKQASERLAEGDIETIRAENPQLVESVVERYNEVTGAELTDEDVLAEIQVFPTKTEITALKREIRGIEEAVARESGEIVTQEDAVKFMQKQERAKRKEGLIESRKFEKEVEAKVKKEERVKRTKIKKAIDRQISSIRKVREKAKRPKSKYTAEVNEELSKIKAFSELTSEQAFMQVRNLQEKYGDTPPEHIILRNKLITTFANLKNLNTKQLNNALNFIEKLKAEGVEGAFVEQQEINNKAQEASDAVVDSLLHEEVKKGESKEDILEQASKGEYVPNGVMRKFWNLTFRANSKWLHGSKGLKNFIDDFTKTKKNETGEGRVQKLLDYTREGGIEDDINAHFGDKFNKLYVKFFIPKGIKGTGALARQINKDGKKKYQLTETGNKYSKAQIRDAYALTFTPDHLKVLKQQFGNDIESKLESILTEKDKQFVQEKFKLFDEMYEMYNGVYKKLNGANLGKVKFYNTVVRKGYVKEASDFGVNNKYQASLAKSSQYNRSKNEHYFVLQNDLQSMMEYTSDMAAYVAKAEKWTINDKVWKDSRVKLALDAKLGDYSKKFQSVISQQHKLEAGVGLGEVKFKAVDWMANNYIKASLMIKLKAIVNQASSGVLAVEHIPPHLWAKYMGKSLLDLPTLKSHKILTKISALYRNRGMAGAKADINAITNSNEFKVAMGVPNWGNIAMLNIRFGDKLGVLIAGYADYNYQSDRIRKDNPTWSDGKIESEAVLAMERHVSSTQQSMKSEDRSLMHQDMNSFSRLFFKYQSSPLQYQAKANQYGKAFFIGRGSRIKNLRNFFLFHSIMPMMYTFILNGFSLDDDDLKEMFFAGLVGNVGSLPLYGKQIVDIARWAKGLKVYEYKETIFGRLSEATKSIQDTADKIKNGEILSATDKFYLRKSIFTMGMFFTGINATTIEDMAYGVSKVNSDIISSAKLISGYTRYSVEGSYEGDDKSIFEKSKDKEESIFDKPSGSGSSIFD